MKSRRFALVLISLLALEGSLHAAPPEPGAADAFFETHVRPVLAEQCYACHGPAQQMGGLRLDSEAAFKKGGTDGAIVRPGDPEKSKIIQAVRYAGPLKMPPTGKLPDDAVAALTEWVKIGAPWPRVPAAAVPASPVDSAARARRFWSFQPIRAFAPPAVHDTKWVQSPIDRFILARLESKGLRPAPPADRRTLIRRATFDLLGLPPTPAEVDAFLDDRAPGAFARVVDRLLASPRYGERWGRYWLDVARYADTKGYTFTEDSRYPNAYLYRDYVIRAFNEDLPFDRFIVQQLAADRLPLKDDRRPLAAMGFLTLGRRFLNNPPDIIDDRIDVTARGLMGLTVGCARCHNHKFDPIPTQDYYSLYGIFNSSVEPGPVSIEPESRYRAYFAHERRLGDDRAALDRLREREKEALLRPLRGEVDRYLTAVAEYDRLSPAPAADEFARSRGLNPVAFGRWKGYLDGDGNPVVFGPWSDVRTLDAPGWAAKIGGLAARWAKQRETGALNPRVADALAKPPASMAELASRYAAVFGAMDAEWQARLKLYEAGVAAAQLLHHDPPAMPAVLDEPSTEALREVVYGSNSPLAIGADELEPLFAPGVRNAMAQLRKEIAGLEKSGPPGPRFAMPLQDSPSPGNVHVFIRGNPGNQGDEAPRRFLQVLSPPDRPLYHDGSGRLELAHDIVSPTNPLTARVLVNRIWLHHFGAGLVRTPSDFGVRGEPPTHPELLDALASEFMRDGWSVKRLHRRIMLSSAYQQSSRLDRPAAQVDPENRLLWRFNPQRLDLEALRDSLLAVSGKLDPTVGGPPVEITEPPFSNRRTVYGFIDRQNLPAFFRTFDFASPDTTSPQRLHTTVPQQALFMMNSPFVIDQARALVRRLGGPSADPAARIRTMYRLLFSRDPSRQESALGLEFLRAPADAAPADAVPAWQYGYGGIDGGKVAFHPLPYFTGSAWQGGRKLPDPALGFALLNAAGGHPGADAQHAVIRRWIAPRAMVVRIDGVLKHPEARGDGVQGRIVSSRLGVLGSWTAHHGETKTRLDSVAVERGDALDFVVDPRAENSYDSFAWAPVIAAAASMIRTAASGGGPEMSWSAEAQFGGPPEKRQSMTAWERYAQVLLETNEFDYVD